MGGRDRCSDHVPQCGRMASHGLGASDSTASRHLAGKLWQTSVTCVGLHIQSLRFCHPLAKAQPSGVDSLLMCHATSLQNAWLLFFSHAATARSSTFNLTRQIYHLSKLCMQ